MSSFVYWPAAEVQNNMWGFKFPPRFRILTRSLYVCVYFHSIWSRWRLRCWGGFSETSINIGPWFVSVMPRRQNGT